MKRGFTLVELLAVIIILGIVALIVIPNVNDALSDSKDKLLEKQINSLEGIARSWGTQNINKVEDCYILTIEELKKSGLLENINIINPETNEELDGCIKISYDDSINQYTYTYTEASLCSCSNI